MLMPHYLSYFALFKLIASLQSTNAAPTTFTCQKPTSSGAHWPEGAVWTDTYSCPRASSAYWSCARVWEAWQTSADCCQCAPSSGKPSFTISTTLAQDFVTVLCNVTASALDGCFLRDAHLVTSDPTTTSAEAEYTRVVYQSHALPASSLTDLVSASRRIQPIPLQPKHTNSTIVQHCTSLLNAPSNPTKAPLPLTTGVNHTSLSFVSKHSPGCKCMKCASSIRQHIGTASFSTNNIDCANVEGALASWTTTYGPGGALAVLSCWSQTPMSKSHSNTAQAALLLPKYTNSTIAYNPTTLASAASPSILPKRLHATRTGQSTLSTKATGKAACNWKSSTSSARRSVAITSYSTNTVDCANVEGALASWTTSYGPGGGLAVLTCWPQDPVTVKRREVSTSSTTPLMSISLTLAQRVTSFTATCPTDTASFSACFSSWESYVNRTDAGNPATAPTIAMFDECDEDDFTTVTCTATNGSISSCFPAITAFLTTTITTTLNTSSSSVISSSSATPSSSIISSSPLTSSSSMTSSKKQPSSSHKEYIGDGPFSTISIPEREKPSPPPATTLQPHTTKTTSTTTKPHATCPRFRGYRAGRICVG